MGYQSDKQERYADYESSYDVRLYGQACDICTEDDLRYGSKGNEEHNVNVDKLCVPVHKEYYDQTGKCKTGGYAKYQSSKTVHVGKVFDSFEPEKYTKEKYSRKGFYYCIAWGDLCTAGSAFASETTPADDRYQIFPFNVFTAGHAVGVSFCKAFI